MALSSEFIALSIASLTLFVVAIPLKLKRIKPNRWYGVRLPSTLTNDALWYRINSVYGQAQIIATLAFFVICILIGSWRAGTVHDRLNFWLFIAEAFSPVAIALFSLRRATKEW